MPGGKVEKSGSITVTGGASGLFACGLEPLPLPPLAAGGADAAATRETEGDPGGDCRAAG